MVGFCIYWTFASSESIYTTPMTVHVIVGMMRKACEKGHQLENPKDFSSQEEGSLKTFKV